MRIGTPIPPIRLGMVSDNTLYFRAGGGAARSEERTDDANAKIKGSTMNVECAARSCLAGYPPRGRDDYAAKQPSAYFAFDFDFDALLPEAVAEAKSSLETFVPLSDTPAIKPALP